MPRWIVFAKPEDLETWPNHLSFRFLTRVRSHSSMAACLLLVTCPCMKCSVPFGSISHLKGLHSFLKLCCQGPWFTGIQKYGNDKGTHQLHLWSKRYFVISPNWLVALFCCEMKLIHIWDNYGIWHLHIHHLILTWLLNLPFHNFQNYSLVYDPLGITHIQDVSPADMGCVRSVALLELTSMLDTHSILYTRRRSKRRHKGNFIYSKKKFWMVRS